MEMTSFGNPLLVNRDYAGADVKILTGFIDRIFAGVQRKASARHHQASPTMANHNYR